jgi:5-methylcytosine-specific restriction endonuclease McrA
MSNNHQSVLNKNITLILNRSWQPINILTVRDAIVGLMGGSNGHAIYAVDIQTDIDGNLVNANPVPWDIWKNLEVRDCDLYIQTRDRKIRVPTVVISQNYNKLPFRRPKLSKRAIFERDGYTCLYSGKKLSKSELSVDHVIPVSRGGKNTFENLVTCEKGLNQKKGNKLLHEIGLKLTKLPKPPPSLPVVITTEESKHPDWIPFLLK